MRTMVCLGVALLIGVVGCNKDNNAAGGGPAGSGAAPAAGGATTKLTEAQLDEAYKLADPDKVDKSITAVTAKLGPPSKVEGDASIWYGISKDGKGCRKLKISKTKGVDSGGADNKDCGLK